MARLRAASVLALGVGLALGLGLGLARAATAGDAAPSAPTASAAAPAGDSGYSPDSADERQREAATSEPACIACHEKARPELVRAWRESRHAAKGVGCTDCHGRDHSNMFGERGAVSAAVCARCHKDAAEGFARSGHARAFATLAASPRFLDEPAGLREATCVPCHAVGAADRLDRSVGRCDACHAGHSFSAEAARRPEACATCHAGAEHPQADAFAASKHGVLLAAGSAPAASAPSCAGCHMPRGAHDTSVGVTTLPGLDEGAREARRADAIASCAPCHATRFAAEALAAGDAVKADAEAILARARSVIEALDRDGLLRPGERRDPARPLVLGPGQLEHAGSEIERRYFRMWRASAQDAWKAAYHQAPAVVRPASSALRASLAWIESEAARLRREAKQ